LLIVEGIVMCFALLIVCAAVRFTSANGLWDKRGNGILGCLLANVGYTEDLKPYIPVKVMIGKWISTIVVNPLIAALVAGVMLWF